MTHLNTDRLLRRDRENPWSYAYKSLSGGTAPQTPCFRHRRMGPLPHSPQLDLTNLVCGFFYEGGTPSNSPEEKGKERVNLKNN